MSALLLISGLLMPAVFQAGPALADTWVPVDTGGFGSGLNTRASSMAVYNDGSGEKLYVGTWNGGDGCGVYRYDGSSWTPVGTGGLGNPNNTEAYCMAVFQSKLYVGTINWTDGCEVLRYDGGVTWTRVNTGSFVDNPVEALSMAVYDDGSGEKLYVGTSWGPTVRFQLHSTTDGTTWVSVTADGFGFANNQRAACMAVYDDGSGEDLYIGTLNPNGCEVISYDGTTAAQVGTLGLGNAGNDWALSLAVFEGKLYAGTRTGIVPQTGGEVRRYDGVDPWTLVNQPGFGLGFTNQEVSSLHVFKSRLYAGTLNNSGCLVYSTDGAVGPPYTWTSENTNGFGDADQDGAREMIIYDNDLCVGTWNNSSATGCSVYMTRGPSIASVSPTSGRRGQTLDVSITGSNTSFAGGTSAAAFGSGITVNSTTVTDATHATANITISDNAATGARDVNVTTGSEIPKALSGGFTVNKHNAPTVTGITPSSGTNDGTVSITNLAGTNFRDGANAYLIGPSGSGETGGGTITATNVSVVASTKITCKFDLTGATAGSYKAMVTNDDDQSGSKTDAFTVTEAGIPTWYLAEGTTAWGFDCYITIENPNNEQVSADITYMTDEGATSGGTVTLPAGSQATVNPADTLGDKDFSTKVECKEGKTIAVDRTMSWTGEGAPSPDGHCSIGVTSPAKTWYLAEGSSAWGFECWLLIQNPNSTEATAQVTYMIEGADPVTVEKKIPANQRKTYSMAEDIGAKDASIKVVSDIPIIPERAMYRNNRRSGHDSIGTTAPAADYYLAEGTTNYGFTTYVLVQNPQDSATDVNVTYLTNSGDVPHPANPINMPANSRCTIRVNDFLPGSDFSTKVSGSQAIIAERAMYWGAGTALGEASHDSIGMSEPHTTFYLPDGQAGGGYETYTLVANPNDSAVTVEISYLTPDGAGNVVFTETIGANSRDTYSMGDKGINGRAAVLVTSKTAGAKIMVERAMYWNGRGAGTDTIGGFGD
ncbi:MAG: hypothetical protein KJ907_10650 [Actinobacteria bacterium]|nr:hypothetical protein [Actinomycetota bacterium]MBU4403175.1 hypothetical protein [Actinomycetota bacterium]MBU4442200.1 hypothetical protein [Actinomycetota bacterium]